MNPGMPPPSSPVIEEVVEEMLEMAAETVMLAMIPNFGQSRGLESEGGRVDVFRMFDWLLGIERERGRVDDTTMSEEGRRWLLTKALGATLTDSIYSIARITADARQFQNMAAANAMLSTLMAQNLNAANELHGIFSEHDKTEEMMGNRR